MMATPDGLRRLVDRFDPSNFDAPAGQARIRLIVVDEGEWDVLASAGGVRIVAANRGPAPEATLSADRATWDRIATDLRGGMYAYRAGRLVNAAGAWADDVGKLAGAKPIGLVPKRRTVITFDPPAGADIGRWPAVIDVDEQWYVKPDAGRLLASPADETPSLPCDARPDEYDVAVVVDRLSRATTLQVPRIVARWAGLRSFVEDKLLVVGFDPRVPREEVRDEAVRQRVLFVQEPHHRRLLDN
jgi:glycine/D-amino acid oxidase-like deaminating enzyme